jgi:hypothetical protein
MKRSLLSMCLVSAVACSRAPTAGDAGADTAGDAGVDAGVAMDFSTGRKILNYLEGKTLVMAGRDIPECPFGISEAVDLGVSTQCYRAITIRVANGAFASTVEGGALATLPDGGLGCDHTATTSTSNFTSMSVLIDNVVDNGACFDVTLDFGAFGEEGRGRIAPDGTSVTLELYFRRKASQHRCEDGAVGSQVNLIIGSPGTGAGKVAHPVGDTLQVYRIQ